MKPLWIKMGCPFRFMEHYTKKDDIKKVTIQEKAGKWYVSISIEIPDPIPVFDPQSKNPIRPIGIDVGCKDLAITSDGKKYYPDQKNGFNKWNMVLKRAQKKMSRKKGAKKGEEKSKRFIKAKDRVARLMGKRAEYQHNCWHNITTQITRKHDVIGIEDLQVKNMVKNHKLARSISDKCFRIGRTQLEYKAKEKGCKVIAADPWYPSSKTCNVCGHKNTKLVLMDREWVCKRCGTCLDRDINAAINLKNIAIEEVKNN